MQVKQGVLTVVRGLDVMEFGGIPEMTLRCTELSLLSVRVIVCWVCELLCVCSGSGLHED